jgi:hypothetical protein
MSTTSDALDKMASAVGASSLAGLVSNAVVSLGGVSEGVSPDDEEPLGMVKSNIL